MLGRQGWLHGNLDGRAGMFPVEYVTPIKYSSGITEARLSSSGEKLAAPNDIIPAKDYDDQSTIIIKEPTPQPEKRYDDSGNSSSGEGAGVFSDGSSVKPPVDDGKHSLFQFALDHFRGAKESGLSNTSLPSTGQKKKKKGSKEGMEWTWKQLVEHVKFSQSPLKESLLPLEGELSQLAIETFISIMRYMGDFPMEVQQTEVHCVYSILMNCHKHQALRDEVYCQIMKQTTNNKSSVPESCQRGWRLFSVIAAYFTCSDVLKPYLLKYLETNAYDKRRAFHGTALVCLQNIRKTFRYGGRKNVPSIEEITAITAGRNSKRQIYRLPGGTEKVINTKSTSVVQDIIEELCIMINVRSPIEQEEFSLYCIVDSDTFTMPLAREEYILDVTTELLKNKQVFYLIFCRSVYYHPIRMDNPLYIEVVFNQVAPDYLAGLLLVTPGGHIPQGTVYDVAKVAALMHRAADLEAVPTIKEVRFLLPKPILTAREVKPQQWLKLVQSSWSEVCNFSSMEAKAAALEILQNWPLFGSAFFGVERVTEPDEFVENILALNKNGVHFLDDVTHETLFGYPLDKILSTRKVKGNDGELYLDMKCGNLMKPKILTLRTSQAHEISRQIKQYIVIEQKANHKDKGDFPKDMTLSR